MLKNGTVVTFDIEGDIGTAEVIDSNVEDKQNYYYQLNVISGDNCDIHKEDDGELWVNAKELKRIVKYPEN